MDQFLNITYDWVSSDDIERVLEIEKQSYPIDEAASLETLQFRKMYAGELFLGAYIGSPEHREIIGYICSTLSPSDTLTHESMTNHVPSSASVCIHSVCVSQAYRRKGIGLNLLREYLSRLGAARDNGLPYQRALLITHVYLQQFYERAGFEWVGKSNVVHGPQPWYEMRKVFDPNSPAIAPHGTLLEDKKVTTGIWEALQHPSSMGYNSHPLSSFPGGIPDLTQPHPEKQGIFVNKFDILCPRSACASIILKRGVGELVERTSTQMDLGGLPAQPILPALPTPPETCHWWLITPSPMEFENIGFSRPVQNSPGPNLKLLACAECDLGPLGWCEEGGKEFWLACTRVGYRK